MTSAATGAVTSGLQTGQGKPGGAPATNAMAEHGAERRFCQRLKRHAYADSAEQAQGHKGHESNPRERAKGRWRPRSRPRRKDQAERKADQQAPRHLATHRQCQKQRQDAERYGIEKALPLPARAGPSNSAPGGPLQKNEKAASRYSQPHSVIPATRQLPAADGSWPAAPYHVSDFPQGGWIEMARVAKAARRNAWKRPFTATSSCRKASIKWPSRPGTSSHVVRDRSPVRPPPKDRTGPRPDGQDFERGCQPASRAAGRPEPGRSKGRKPKVAKGLHR